MQEVVKAVQSGEIPDAEIACIIASNAEAGGIQKARTLGIPEKDIVVIDPREYRIGRTLKTDREMFGQRILLALRDHGATVVAQNGWIPYTPDNVTETYAGRIFNQHPGPPEEFGGKGMMGKAVHAAVLKFQELAGRTFDTSVVAHDAQAGLDTGGVRKREKVPVLPGDTVDALQQRALPVEHRVQIDLLKSYVRKELVTLAPESFVHPDEQHLLEEAKRYAREHYPNG